MKLAVNRTALTSADGLSVSEERQPFSRHSGKPLLDAGIKYSHKPVCTVVMRSHVEPSSAGYLDLELFEH